MNVTKARVLKSQLASVSEDVDDYKCKEHRPIIGPNRSQDHGSDVEAQHDCYETDSKNASCLGHEGGGIVQGDQPRTEAG
jgi:threonine dehydrogenase-like Zn-dependent dehydrogenase